MTGNSTTRAIARLPRQALGRLRRLLDLHGETVQRLEGELRAERERVSRLEAELDELRRDSLRVAELTDLVEQRLTPGDPGALRRTR